MGVDDFEWISASSRIEEGPEVAVLWGDLGEESLSGSFVKLPGGYSGSLHTIGGDLQSVIIQGDVAHSVSMVTDRRVIRPGGYFESEAGVPHSLACQSDEACTMYVRTSGEFRVR